MDITGEWLEHQLRAESVMQANDQIMLMNSSNPIKKNLSFVGVKYSMQPNGIRRMGSRDDGRLLESRWSTLISAAMQAQRCLQAKTFHILRGHLPRARVYCFVPNATVFDLGERPEEWKILSLTRNSYIRAAGSTHCEYE